MLRKQRNYWVKTVKSTTGTSTLENEDIENGLPSFSSTVKPVYNDHPWDSKIVAVVDRWLLFRGTFVL